MATASLILIIIGAAIITVLLLVRLVLRRRDAAQYPPMPRVEPEFDPLFAELQKEPAVLRQPTTVKTRDEPVSTVIDEPPPVMEKTIRRRPPRVAEDPHRVVALNIVAGEQGFAGGEVRAALEEAGLEFGEWQIFHYYVPGSDSPPLFSLANMVKPGSFDPAHMEDAHIPGLSLFMVPAGLEDDVAGFDTMLAVARRLAEQLGGEVRDARRSVLTRQAISLIREQLNEWRCKVQAAQH